MSRKLSWEKVRNEPANLNQKAGPLSDKKAVREARAADQEIQDGLEEWMERKKPDLEPMPASKFFLLPVGAQVWIYWAKDDDPNYVRMNGIYSVAEALDSDGVILVEAGSSYYDFSRDILNRIQPGENIIGDCRGYAYAYEIGGVYACYPGEIDV